MENDKQDELLIELKTDVGWIKNAIGNHLKHHQRYSLLAISTALTAIVSLVIALLTK